eukprot:scaffold18650_cov112-Isochrysis_galbana.AAC.2
MSHATSPLTIEVLHAPYASAFDVGAWLVASVFCRISFLGYSSVLRRSVSCLPAVRVFPCLCVAFGLCAHSWASHKPLRRMHVSPQAQACTVLSV